MDIAETPSRNSDALIELTADVVAAYVSNNPVPVGELPNLISDVHAALGRVGGTAEQPPADKQKPAVNPKRSVHDDYIVCLEDGKKLKMLKRHLMTHYSMTPDQYRQKWGLAADYPMVAPNYAEQRRALAKAIGLGTKRRKTKAR
jgi:predicted transcriptional regulator